MTLSEYSTEELERLTTLTEATAKPGEFLSIHDGPTHFRSVTRVVKLNGKERTPAESDVYYGAYERRVTSFTDATELDPPQAEMLAELARRKAPVFTVGELVVERDVPGATVITNERRGFFDLAGRPGYSVAAKLLRPATDAEVAAYHRAHCQTKPAPLVISNATHAGQWVKWGGQPCLVLSGGDELDDKVFIVDAQTGNRRYVLSQNLTLIDPPVWPK